MSEEAGFIGPQLPPDDILYRRGILSREVFHHRRDILQRWLKEKTNRQPVRYLGDDYYVKLGDSDLVLGVEMYLTISYGNNQEGEDA